MTFLILFLLSIIELKEGRENFSIHFVNVSDGRRDMSIVGSRVDDEYNFKLVNGYIEKSAIVVCTLVEQINSTGWGHLLVKSSGEYSDELQAYFSGVIEGVISHSLIAAHWYNTFDGYCSKPSKYCKDLDRYLRQNFMSMVEKTRNSDGFLKMIRLQLWQIKGIQDGFDGDWKMNSKDINEEHLLKLQNQLFKLYLLQVDCDLTALSNILDGHANHNQFAKRKDSNDGRCSAFIKYVNGSIYTSHVTWSSYKYMLRLTKLYDFQYRLNNEVQSPLIPARKVSFSSYPGVLSSSDDFYITSAGLVTIETTIENLNDSLWQPLRHMASEIILEFARVQAANRLATSGSEWSRLFATNNSGTYNNQWMIVDDNVMKNHRTGERIPDGALYVVEQLPGLVISEDVTEHLRTSTYWASYNLPYNRTIWKMGAFQLPVDKYGDFFDYQNCPRAKIFKRDSASVVDIESLMRLMRYNDFRHDPLATCDCSPPYSAAVGVSARDDLNLISGRYPFHQLAYSLYGGVDMKFTTTMLAKELSFVAINGPTYDQQPVFDWTQETRSRLRHRMHPQRFEFPPVLTPFS